jgi:putative MATE family efflux protein
MREESPSESKTGTLTSGSIGKSIFSMAGPIFLGMLAFSSANLVDTFFVAQLGTPQLAAMGFLGPVFALGLSIISSIGAGLQSVVSRAIGSNDAAAARGVTLHSLILALSIVVVAIGIGLILREQIFRTLGANESTLPYAEAYFNIWLVSLVVMAIPTLAGSALVANGNSRAASLFYIGAAVLNAIFDPILIFGYGPFPALGIEGAALSSLISYLVVAAIAIATLFRDEALRPRWVDVVGHRIVKSWRRVLRVALPIMATGLVTPFLFGVLIRVYASFGDHVVAAATASSRIMRLATLVAVALGMGLAAVVGQNWGAGLRKRVIDAVGLSQRVSLIWGTIAWVGIAAGSGLIATAFVDDPLTSGTLRVFLLIDPASYGVLGVFSVCSQTLNAIDRASAATTLSLLSGVAEALVVVGAAFVSNDLVVVLLALTAVEWATALVAALYVRRILRTAEMET